MKKVILVMAVLSLMGCGSDSKNGSGSAAGGSIEELGAAATGWKTACIVESGGTSSLTLNNTYADNTEVSTLTYFTDATCGAGETAHRDTSTLVTKGTSAGNASATSYDITLIKKETMTLSAAKTTQYNTPPGECGRTDWVEDQWLDVTNSNCFTGGGTFFDIFKISGSSLSYGDRTAPNDGTTEAKRPTVLDSTVFTKY